METCGKFKLLIVIANYSFEQRTKKLRLSLLEQIRASSIGLYMVRRASFLWNQFHCLVTIYSSDRGRTH